MARILHCKLCADDAASSSSSRKKVFPAQSLEAPSSGAGGARLSASEPSSCAVIAVAAQKACSGSPGIWPPQITHPDPKRLRFLRGPEHAQRNNEKCVRRKSYENVVLVPPDKSDSRPL
jgi:hypothetical protein